jgi:outer membrane protein OmpA-like peptidoglycan-associated protein
MNLFYLRTWSLKRSALITCLVVFMTLFMALAADAQSDYTKQNRRHQWSYYRGNESKLARACHILTRKRNHTPRKNFFASNRKPRVYDQAEVPAKEKTAPKKPIEVAQKTVPEKKPLPVEPKVEQVSDKKLDDLHKKEDNVLAENKLPVPSSQKHEEVRKEVADKLKDKPLKEPLKLAPLYFQFNQDEFSVVDMEPFLIAVEYALQGHTVLIEGHTDNRGQDDYNVKLSVKRVQKIRQLMLDMGVPDDRISIIGYGEEHGKEKGKDETEHQNNRRVDFTVF